MARTPRDRTEKDDPRAEGAAASGSAEPAPAGADAAGAARPRQPGSAERRRRELEERQAGLAGGEPRRAPSAERRRHDAEERRAALAPAEAPQKRRRRERRPPAAEETAVAAAPPDAPSDDMLTRWLESQDGDLRAFVASRSAEMDQRRYQLSLIKDFVDDPTRFGVKPGDIPTSTSLAEFAERRSELQYRINTVRTFLDLLNEELRLLDQAEAYAQKAGAPGS